jgi:hypothetical protein
MQHTVIETITPSKAKDLLKLNTKNRSLRAHYVSELARQMRDGLWQLSSQGIAIDANNILADGQHRLHAVVEANVAVQMQVTYNMNPDAFQVLDGGLVRTVSDRLPLLKDKESNRLVVSVVTHYLRCTGGGNYGRQSVDQVENEFLDKTDAYIAMAELMRSNGKRIGLTKASICAALSVYIHLDKAAGIHFTKQYFTGEGISTGQPAYTLREAALTRRLESVYDQYWKTISACAADINKKPLLVLYAATKDMVGNVYHRMQFERKAKALKGVETKKRTKALSAVDQAVAARNAAKA